MYSSSGRGKLPPRVFSYEMGKERRGSKGIEGGKERVRGESRVVESV